jgi:hypothetical protein
MAVLLLGMSACGSVSGKTVTEAAQPRFHKGYYKKHVHRKRYHIGRIHIKLFEKQGTKTVKKKG